MTPIQITHFSDLLCVWAYVSQARVDELTREFGTQIDIRFRYFPVFGDTQTKFLSQWADKGGISAYARHVIEVADQFGHVAIHPQIWVKAAPRSSLPAHLHLNAVQLMEQAGQADDGAAERLAWRLRQAFFAENQDIADADTICGVAEELAIDVDALRVMIARGSAFAALAQDIQQARDLEVRASPTLIFNEDRQRLTGNVGYRIIEANVRELLSSPDGQFQSWC